MKVNATQLVLFVLAAVVGWMVLKPALLQAQPASPTLNPSTGTTSGGDQPSVFQSMTKAFAEIANTVNVIAQTSPKEN